MCWACYTCIFPNIYFIRSTSFSSFFIFKYIRRPCRKIMKTNNNGKVNKCVPQLSYVASFLHQITLNFFFFKLALTLNFLFRLIRWKASSIQLHRKSCRFLTKKGVVWSILPNYEPGLFENLLHNVNHLIT